jgi:hypothetical protein
MLLRVVAALIALSLGGPGWAKPSTDAPPHFAKGSPYKNARDALIRMGYAPIPQRHPKPNDYCGTDYQEPGEPDLCVVYPAVVDCGGTGIRPCLFAFERKSDHKRLVVTTYGELTSRLMVLRTEWQTSWLGGR